VHKPWRPYAAEAQWKFPVLQCQAESDSMHANDCQSSITFCIYYNKHFKGCKLQSQACANINSLLHQYLQKEHKIQRSNCEIHFPLHSLFCIAGHDKSQVQGHHGTYHSWQQLQLSCSLPFRNVELNNDYTTELPIFGRKQSQHRHLCLLVTCNHVHWWAG
jgi:hypothetical protein